MSDDWKCPRCDHEIEDAKGWVDGQCTMCGAYYTWEDQVVITLDRSKNSVTINKVEYERLKALENKSDVET